MEAHLRLCVNAVHTSASVGVPEFDAPIRSTTTWCKQVALEGTPCQSLHSGLMVVEAVKVWAGGPRSSSSWVPNVQQVVIATTGQLLSWRWPFQTANLLLVGSHSPNNMLSDSYIMVQDHVITAACGHGSTIPRQSTDTCGVALQRSQLHNTQVVYEFLCVHIHLMSPSLGFYCRSNSQMIGPLQSFHGAHIRVG